MTLHMQHFDYQGKAVCGLDEAGRGCLAGPVFAAAVILHSNDIPRGLNDSKKLSESRRLALRAEIENRAQAWAVASVDASLIDEINILQASIRAMHLAVAQLEVSPALLLVDGNRFHPYPGIPHQLVIRGDATYSCIAAASILAKTYRDDWMKEAHKLYPGYDWEHNKGYPTARHIAALEIQGASPLHRKSFVVRKQLRFPF